MKPLVCFFTAQGRRTAGLATALAYVLGAERFEIVPDPPYSPEDLNYMDPNARVNREQAAQEPIPLATRVDKFADYELVLLGFPIWFGAIPLAVKSFCRGYDWSGKRVAIFASGDDDVGRFAEILQPFMPGAEIVSTRRFQSPNTPELLRWAKSLLN